MQKQLAQASAVVGITNAAGTVPTLTPCQGRLVMTTCGNASVGCRPAPEAGRQAAYSSHQEAEESRAIWKLPITVLLTTDHHWCMRMDPEVRLRCYLQLHKTLWLIGTPLLVLVIEFCTDIILSRCHPH